jgi:hypothetical protein
MLSLAGLLPGERGEVQTHSGPCRPPGGNHFFVGADPRSPLILALRGNLAT